VIELLPETSVSLDLSQLFERTAPVHVDLGCGDGSFLRALAAEQPHTNFLGIERLLHRVRSSDRKARELENVRIIRSETGFVLRHLLPPESVEIFYLLFPDPWPKRRHHRRRLVTTEFLEAISACLTNGGSLFIATDHDDYFAAIRRALSGATEFAMIGSDWNLPSTTFEKKFVASGTAIHRLELRKTSPVT
jgi:tRNA (guanine-N7-)-methyltransferase